MNSDYIAWNGERYVWPPPDGWYLAGDGRWWAPDTGPEMDGWADNPAVSRPQAGPNPDPAVVAPDDPDIDLGTPTGAAPAIATSTGAPLPDSPVGEPLAPPAGEPVMLDPMPTEQQITPPAGSAPENQPVGGSETQLMRTFEPSGTTKTTTGQTSAVVAPGPDQLPAEHQSAFAPSTNEGVDSPSILAEADAAAPAVQVKRSRTMPMVAAGLLAAAALGIAALLALFGGNGDDEQQQPSASLQPSEEPGGLVVTTGPVDGDAMGDGAMDDGAMEDGAMEDGSSTTQSEDAMSDDESSDSTSSAEGTDDTASIGQFRALLENNEITAVELTGDDLEAFGVTACSYAQSSGDLAEYEQIRSGVLDGAQNDELTIDELRFIVDAAVTVFCPDDATRLGITLEAG